MRSVTGRSALPGGCVHYSFLLLEGTWEGGPVANELMCRPVASQSKRMAGPATSHKGGGTNGQMLPVKAKGAACGPPTGPTAHRQERDGGVTVEEGETQRDESPNAH